MLKEMYFKKLVPPGSINESEYVNKNTINFCNRISRDNEKYQQIK